MLKDALKHQFEMSYYVIKENLDGIADEETVVRVGEDGGNINWILGHIISVRNPIVKFLGGEAFWSDEERGRFKQGSEVIADLSRIVAHDKLIQTLDQSQETILDLFEKANDETFKVDFSGHPAGMRITTLAFHETYHAGQLGIIRRLLGHTGKI